MSYNPDAHHRRSIRLRGYDYTQAGAYFVTIVTKDREAIFGAVIDGNTHPSSSGEIVTECWNEISSHFPNTALDAFVLMPNHLHGIIIIEDVGARHAVPLHESFARPVSSSLPTIIRSFKSVSTKRINHLRGTLGLPVWQRNYYEHVVRAGDDLDRIRQYIADNPSNWHTDEYNPSRS